MKKSFIFFRSTKLSALLLALVIICFTSCKKNDETVTDDRDAFVGTYSTTVAGNIHMELGSEYADVPVSFDGSITIAKQGNSNMVKVSGDFETTGVVSGNTISFDACTHTGSSNGVTMTINESFKSSTLDGNTLVIKSTLTGTAYYQGYSLPLTGYMNYIAVK